MDKRRIMKCAEEHEEKEVSCKNTACKYWIDYDSDLNCTIICARRNGPLTLKETAKRMGVSYVRIKQIQDKAIKKINKIITVNN